MNSLDPWYWRARGEGFSLKCSWRNVFPLWKWIALLCAWRGSAPPLFSSLKSDQLGISLSKFLFELKLNRRGMVSKEVSLCVGAFERIMVGRNVDVERQEMIRGSTLVLSSPLGHSNRS